LALESLTCYVSKVNFGTADKNEIFGFGIAKGGSPNNPRYILSHHWIPNSICSLTSPCEFVTLAGFQSLAASGRVESVMREELHFFLPMFINPTHGTLIKKHFEEACSKIMNSKFHPSQVLTVLPKLLNSTVVTFMNGTTHTSERALHGYFFFHRLFLWAISEYPTLLGEATNTIKQFVTKPEFRLKKNTPNVGEWLASLTVTDVDWKIVSIR
jgi:hypothetical protein